MAEATKDQAVRPVEGPELQQESRQGGSVSRPQAAPHPASERAQEQRSRPPREQYDGPPREGDELVSAAARAGRGHDKLSDDEKVDALEWFLSDTDATDLTHSFEINVGSITSKRWVTWTVKPVDMDRLRAIRRRAQSPSRRQRAQGDAGQLDTVTANIQIVLEGTVSPDLRAAAKDLGLVAAEDAVRTRFAHKPGLLDQIAGEIMGVSGYDDEDVREVDAARG